MEKNAEIADMELNVKLSEGVAYAKYWQWG